MLFKCHRYATYNQLVHVHMRQLCSYIPHINSVQSAVSPQPLVYIHFTLMTCHWANMPTTLHMHVPLHIDSTLLHIHVKQVGQ